MVDKEARQDQYDKINNAFSEAVIKVIGAVGVASGSVSGTGQATSGAQGTAGGTSTQAGQATQGAATDVKTKDDVGGPESMESSNVSQQVDLAARNKSRGTFFDAIWASNAGLFDAGSKAVSLAVLSASQQHALINQQSTDHRDLAHDRQWNINETDMYATIAGTVVAKVLSSLGVTPKNSG